MPFIQNEDGKMVQVPTSIAELIKIILPWTWEFFIVFNTAILLFPSIYFIYLTGYFEFYTKCWLPLFLFTLLIPPFSVASWIIFILPDYLLSRHSPSYKKKTDFAELFRTLTGLLYFAGRQVAKADDKELNQLVKLRVRLDAAIEYATKSQREAMVNKTELLPHE